MSGGTVRGGRRERGWAWGQRLVGIVSILLGGCDLPSAPGPGLESDAWTEDRPGLSVTVLDEAGAPLPGAWVSVAPGAWERETDAAGLASFAELGAGSFTVTASGAGFAAVSEGVEVGEDDVALSLSLQAEEVAGTTLAGAVLDRVGAPVEGASVLIDGLWVASTDADGAFEATGLSGGSLLVQITAPESSGLLDWEIPDFALGEGARAEIGVVLGGKSPEGATWRGTTICVECHEDYKDSYPETVHGGAGRLTDQIEDVEALDGLSESFLGGDTVEIEALGASVALARDSGGAWSATITDAWGDSSGALEVVQVYGGHRTGAALAVSAGGVEALLPIAWALTGQGQSSKQDEEGWIFAWTEGWFDGSGRLALDAEGRPGVEASFALQCAGCHSTGAVLTESSGLYTLEADPLARALETIVGCEACHGPGGEHVAAADPSLILNPRYLPPHQRVEVCARCHERSTPTAHPFSSSPGYPTDADGGLLGPLDLLSDFASAAPVRWLEAPVSRLGWDQVGDLRSSPHLAGEQGYAAACEDCHDPHGGSARSSLRVEPWDNTLCTSCHASLFPDEEAEAEHAHHDRFDPGEWSPGSCTGCHMPRMGHAVRPDAVSGAGELHAHGLDFIEPAASLAEFDAAGVDELALGQAPVSACIDCHLQSDAEEEDAGSNCPCPSGNAKKRSTHEHFQEVYEIVWGLR